MTLIDNLRERAARARIRFQDAKDRYELTQKQYHYYDKGYWLGYSHALESALDVIEKNDLDDSEVP